MFLVKKFQLLKKFIYEDHTLSLTLCQLVRDCPKFLKNLMNDISNGKFPREPPLKPKIINTL
jgi:hypothetical protein